MITFKDLTELFEFSIGFRNICNGNISCNMLSEEDCKTCFVEYYKEFANSHSRILTIDMKSPAFIIDELFTTLQKCWIAQEDVMKETDDNKIADASKRAQELNNRRNKLMRALDRVLGFEEITLTTKTYDKGEKK